ncbi:hypothetical protein TRIATDRAFT_42939 [Trichoderma atroviride IMI 206040]|uniref:F-box domain-containing protein n=1 Tax=Hypocrea atroviridis (strain ATCC 20476 / IMI 206040) TaxID=452589 RepID=G9NRR3_HYPAI|nr:uncharacterized protein TRIATDRAFT_42939 [Trichoderma atroviride IMI 206040]EHK46695.1 hypothetical protein TRIATDRAFT_42939 [Trichoderma atroviride IMI 206040]
MNIIKLLSSFQRLRPHTRSYLLRLPVEILLEILNLLPPHCLLVIYQTCRPLRAITHQYFLSGRGEILATLEDKLRYLTCLARSLPDYWVCARCCKLHKIVWRDVPATHLYNPECEYGSDLWRDPEDIQIRNSFALNMPAHRHVQLTLKYTRLRTIKWRQRRRLQRLLEPHYFPDKERFYNHKEEGILEQSSFYPKVIDGRYVHLSVQTYLGAQNTISRQFLRRERICHHIRDYKTNLTMAFDMAFSAKDSQLFFSCSSCGTDFSIQASPELVIICTWQDLGPEGTVFDPEWESMFCDLTRVSHQPGNARKLYDQLENNEDYLVL